MKSRGWLVAAVAIAVAAPLLLGACTLTVAELQGKTMPPTQGIKMSENPEYLGSFWRAVALPLYPAGLIAQRGGVETLYTAMRVLPGLWGMTLDEQRYIDERWRIFFEQFTAAEGQP